MANFERDVVCTNCRKVILKTKLTTTQAATYDNEVNIVSSGFYEFPSVPTLFAWAEEYRVPLPICKECSRKH